MVKHTKPVWQRSIPVRRPIAVLLFLGTSCCSEIQPNVVFQQPDASGNYSPVEIHTPSVCGEAARPGAGGFVLINAEDVVTCSNNFAPTKKEVPTSDTKPLVAATDADKPIDPKDFPLHFEFDSAIMTPEGQETFEKVVANIALRRASVIVVTGHTDTMGPADYDMRLSLKRADAVRELLIRYHLRSDIITTAGVGKRQPLFVPTGDQVPEPRNRIVVITVQ